MIKKPSIIAVDFDGTCVFHKYPNVGADVPGAVDVLLRLQADGHKLILWTIRSGSQLDDAVRWFEDRGIGLLGVNSNPAQSSWSDSPKAYAAFYIDDAAVGCPLIPGCDGGRDYADWRKIENLLYPAVSNLLEEGEPTQ